MGVKQKLRGLAIEAFLSDPVRRARERLDDVGRRVRGATPRAELYFQVDDPHSYLLAQAVERMATAYPRLQWELHLVPPPAADVTPEPALAARWALQDAADLAAHWDVDFPADAREPDPGVVLRANQILVVKRPFAEQLQAALQVARALWARDRPAIELAMGKLGHEAPGSVAPATQLAYGHLRDTGHYRGATVRYGSEWYWGIDRLPYLEERLRRDLEDPEVAPVIHARPPESRPPLLLGADPLTLELFFSFRSPYSYLALEQVPPLAAQAGVTLQLRPVLPMVMRGMEMPRAKKLYIVQDAKREAERLGIPFGRICDPLGPGIERCLSAFAVAAAGGRGLELATSLMRGIWSEALDVTSYVDMRRMVDRAGVDWNQVTAAGDDWRALARGNAEELARAGLWGVPSFRIGGYTAWGQDRIPMLADRLRRHHAAVEAAT